MSGIVVLWIIGTVLFIGGCLIDWFFNGEGL